MLCVLLHVCHIQSLQIVGVFIESLVTCLQKLTDAVNGDSIQQRAPLLSILGKPLSKNRKRLFAD